MIKIENIRAFGSDVAMDITAPLYWWKEFDEHEAITVFDSRSAMC